MVSGALKIIDGVDYLVELADGDEIVRGYRMYSMALKFFDGSLYKNCFFLNGILLLD